MSERERKQKERERKRAKRKREKNRTTLNSHEGNPLFIVRMCRLRRIYKQICVQTLNYDWWKLISVYFLMKVKSSYSMKP